jgi:hypothetical protein
VSERGVYVPLRGAGREPDMKTNQRRRGSEGSLGNVYHCGLIFHYKTKLLVIYLIAGSLPLLYDSSIRIHPNPNFLFSSG